MKYALLILPLAIFILGCDNTRYGKIVKKGYCNSSDANYVEDEKSQYVYLQNTSTSKRITFNVATKYNSNEQPGGQEETRTEEYTMNPGDEKLLGCEKKYNIQHGINDRDRFFTRQFKVVGAVVEKE